MKLLHLSWLALFILIISSGCLTYRSIQYEVSLNPHQDNTHEIAITYGDIGSSEAEESEQLRDFAELLENMNGNEFLVDQTEQGIYVLRRELDEEDGALNAKYHGLAKNFATDELSFTVDGEQIRVEIDNSEIGDARIVADGEIERNDSTTTITWPADRQRVFWRLNTTINDDEHHSLAAHYKAYIDSSAAN